MLSLSRRIGPCKRLSNLIHVHSISSVRCISSSSFLFQEDREHGKTKPVVQTDDDTPKTDQHICNPMSTSDSGERSTELKNTEQIMTLPDPTFSERVVKVLNLTMKANPEVESEISTDVETNNSSQNNKTVSNRQKLRSAKRRSKVSNSYQPLEIKSEQSNPPWQSDHHRELPNFLSNEKDVVAQSNILKEGFVELAAGIGKEVKIKILHQRGPSQQLELIYWSGDARKSEIQQCVAPIKEEIPRLAHNLDRVLFSPGVHFLQDPRTRVYNFSPFLKKIISHKDFNFDAIESFQMVSKDTVLLERAKEFSKQFYSSTSSMTGVLSKFYMLLNNYNPSKVDRFGDIEFSGIAYKSPASVIVKAQGRNQYGKVYSIESDRSCDTELILSAMGLCLEVLLTNPEDEFVKYKKGSNVETKQPANVYNYAGYKSFLMRSQLDCFDERLPGNGTFDLKTRASMSIRYDSMNPNIEANTYQIWKLKGDYESFQREREDLIRTGALMKYMFQARIGQMDGIFVAYHNISSIFGFEYIPLSELDEIFYSQKSNDLMTAIPEKAVPESLNEHIPSFIAESQFKFSLDIWQCLLQRHILRDLDKKDRESFRLIFDKYKSGNQVKLRVYVLPVTLEEIAEIQEFPKKFDTRFDNNLPMKERMANLRQHGEQLKKFNEKLLESKKDKLRVYDIETIGTEIGRTLYANASKMPKAELPYRMYYKIVKLDNPAAYGSSYLRTIDVPAKALRWDASALPMMQRERIRRFYTRLGKVRAQRWERMEKAKELIIYKPKY